MSRTFEMDEELLVRLARQDLTRLRHAVAVARRDVALRRETLNRLQSETRRLLTEPGTTAAANGKPDPE